MERLECSPQRLTRKLKYPNWPEYEDIEADDFLLKAVEPTVIQEQLITEEERLGMHI